MKVPLSYGLYPWWPESGEEWIHPDDVDLVRRMIPSDRVFRREGFKGRFAVLCYGQVIFRVKPRLWLTVRSDGLDVGDRIEVLSKLGKNDPFVGRIDEMRWNSRYRRIHYYVSKARKRLPKAFTAEDLRLLDRKLVLADPSRAQRAPTADAMWSCESRDG